jgi:hypothetical protein
VCAVLAVLQADVAHVVSICSKVVIEFGINLLHTILLDRRNKEEYDHCSKDSKGCSNIEGSRVVNVLIGSGYATVLVEEVILNVGISISSCKFRKWSRLDDF